MARREPRTYSGVTCGRQVAADALGVGRPACLRAALGQHPRTSCGAVLKID
eukprot:COSAG02_NODE_58730_length_276_cov_0.875706_1_plen_50_part_01